MIDLEFINPVGLKSDNFSTVRFGKEWAERTQPEKPGDFKTVNMVDAQGKSVGTAKVVGAWVGRLADLPAILIECHHDPVCRTWSGVAQTIAGLHREDNVGYETVVTVLQLQYSGGLIKAASATVLKNLR